MPTLFVHALVSGKEPSNARQYLPQFFRQIIAASLRLQPDAKVAALPCGHYTTGETPFKFLDAYYMASFLDSAFGEV
jgi:hypothetical protein